MIGELNSQIELLAPVRALDDGGGSIVTWTTTASVFAKIERLSSTRDIIGDRSIGLRRISATIRRRAGVALGHRLRSGTVDYDIVSIEDADDRGLTVALIGEEASS